MVWTTRKSIKALLALRVYARPHRRTLLRGGLATFGVVLCRLAMPWPLRGFIELVLPGTSQRGQILSSYLPAWGGPIFWLASSYVLLAAGLGLCEMIQRIAMKQFASRTAHGLRSAALKALLAGKSRAEKAHSADHITRLVSDVARIKAEVSGILVHSTQNGLLFLGVCIVFLFISPKLGLFFLFGGLLAAAIGTRATTRVAASAAGQRKKESIYAGMIEDALEYGELPERIEDVNLKSARADVRTTRLIAVSSFLIHVALALVTALALAAAVSDVRKGTLVPGDLFLFIAYALTVHRRMVQVGRQTARTGKVFAHVRRVAALTTGVAPGSTPVEISPLASHIRLEGVRLFAHTPKAKPRLQKIDLKIDAGTRTVVLGPSGAGKSSLLGLLAGRLAPDRGRILWDELDVTDVIPFAALDVGYLPQNVIFKATRVWRLIGLAGPEAMSAEHETLLAKLGGWKLIANHPQGIRGKIGTRSITRNEARALRLAGILAGTHRLLSLDAVLEGLDQIAAGRRLKAILERADGRTLVLSMSRAVKISHFDRLLFLRKGQIIFDGTPAEWKLRSAQREPDAAAAPPTFPTDDDGTWP